MGRFITISTDALAKLWPAFDSPMWPQMEPFWTSNSGFNLALFFLLAMLALGMDPAPPGFGHRPFYPPLNSPSYCVGFEWRMQFFLLFISRGPQR